MSMAQNPKENAEFNPYTASVPVDKVIIDLHRFPRNQSLLILGPPGIGKSEGVRQFAVQEVLRLKEDLNIRCAKDKKEKYELFIIDNPQGFAKKADEKGIPTNETAWYLHLKNSVVFVDLNKTGAKLDNGELINEVVDELIDNDNLVYLFLDVRLSEVEPSDLVGLPALVRPSEFSPKKKPGADVKFSDYAINIFIDSISTDKSGSLQNADYCEKVTKYVHGILFLDEFTNIQRADVLSMAYKIVLDRMIGFKKISKGVRIIAAGNYAENSAVSQELPSPLLNRFAVISAATPTIDSWRNYMMNQIQLRYPNNTAKSSILKRISHLLSIFFSQKTYEEDFLEPGIKPVTLEPYPTPRSWTNSVFAVAPSIDSGKCKDVTKECFELFPTFVGTKAYNDLINWFTGQFVQFREEMLDYSKEQLDEYFNKNGVYQNVIKFKSFMDDYRFTIENKELWDHSHDLKRFFSNIVALLNEHKNGLKVLPPEEATNQGGKAEFGSSSSPYEEFITIVTDKFQETIAIAGDDGVEKPLFKTITVDLANDVINNILYNLLQKKDDEIKQEINNLKKKFDNDPVYCVKMDFDYDFFYAKGGANSKLGQVTKMIMYELCGDIVPPASRE